MKNLDFRKILRMETGSVILIIFGLILILNPDFGSAAVAAVLGWVLCGAGIAGLVIGFLSWPGLGVGELVVSGLLLGAGVYLLRNPMMLASILGLLLGVLLAVQGLGAVRDALRVRARGGFWYASLVFAVITLVAGLGLIFSPLTTSRLVMTVAGIVMIACGVGNLVNHTRAEKYLNSGDGKIIDADE